MSRSVLTRLNLQAHIFPVTLALLAMLVALAGPDVQLWLRYERDSILAGELWRVLTGHFVHLNGRHLLMNLAALGLIWALAAPVHRNTGASWLVISLSSMLGVSVGLLIFNPTVAWYVGLSGMLHGLFLAGIIANLRAGAHAPEILLLLVLCGKVLWEQTYGPIPGTAEFAGGAVVTDAHLYGLIGGLAGILPYLLLPRK